MTSGNPVLSPLRLSTDKAVYGNRSKVTLKLPELPGDLKDFSLSVVRRDCALQAFPSAVEVQKTIRLPENALLPSAKDIL